MYFKQFLHDETGCSSYFIASRHSRVAAVVDPQRDIDCYLDLATERGYTIRFVIDTHIHADHVSGNRKLAEAAGAELYLQAEADVVFPFQPLRDGDKLRLGQIILQAVHTPGHRPEAMCLLVINPPRSPEPSIVLSGDTLFVGDVGRPDLGGPEGAAQQYESVRKLLALEDYVEVFPAHFEGACGKGMCGRPSSTIGFERRFNPVLQLSRDDFLAFAAEVPPRPLNMNAIVAANTGTGDYAWAPPANEQAIPSITAKDAATSAEADGAFMLDVREPHEYASGHVPGAVSIPQADLALRLCDVPNEREVIVVCRSGARSLQAARFLKGIGYQRVINLEGGTLAWRAEGLPTEPQ
jgi:glyoxylase-like metal-dependent hydrolase (beta-lactamase superfamily II)/rhodanese-related sulfurtransferase